MRRVRWRQVRRDPFVLAPWLLTRPCRHLKALQQIIACSCVPGSSLMYCTFNDRDLERDLTRFCAAFPDATVGELLDLFTAVRTAYVPKNTLLTAMIDKR